MVEGMTKGKQMTLHEAWRLYTGNNREKLAFERMARAYGLPDGWHEHKARMQHEEEIKREHIKYRREQGDMGNKFPKVAKWFDVLKVKDKDLMRRRKVEARRRKRALEKERNRQQSSARWEEAQKKKIEQYYKDLEEWHEARKKWEEENPEKMPQSILDERRKKEREMEEWQKQRRERLSSGEAVLPPPSSFSPFSRSSAEWNHPFRDIRPIPKNPEHDKNPYEKEEEEDEDW